MRLFSSSHSQRRLRIRAGFSLVELLVAIAVLSIITLVLVSILNQVGMAWQTGESQSQFRQRARSVIELMARDIRMATLSHDPDHQALQMVINPSAVSFQNRDSIFCQSPIATDTSRGDLAEVGYFVRWTNSQANLCRFFVNPSETADYLIYDQPDGWVSDAILNNSAPADEASHYRGLFLENVLGLWITAYTVDAAGALQPVPNFDSRMEKKLPDCVKITMVFLDRSAAQILKDTGAESTVRGLYASSADGEVFLEQLPKNLRSGADIVTLTVNLSNRNAL